MDDSNAERYEKIRSVWRARRIKSEVYLKYTLLADLLHIVKRYGRNDGYNFEKDEKLTKIISGDFSDQKTNDKNRSILAIDSFMTIWLLTLPEKFIK